MWKFRRSLDKQMSDVLCTHLLNRKQFCSALTYDIMKDLNVEDQLI